MLPPTRQIDRLWQSDWSLSGLLAFLFVAVFIVRPLEVLGYDIHLVAAAAFSFILVTGIIAVSRTRLTAMIFGSIAVTSVVIHWARYAIFGAPWIGVDAAGAIVACGMLVAIVLYQVFREGPITSQRIQGAIAAYLLIALIFAAAYTLVDVYVPHAFAGAVPVELTRDPLQPFMYFSFVTLTTVGYGDITAVSTVARSLVMLEALIGQLFPSILLARLVSMEIYYRQHRFEREQAALDREALAREVAKQLREDR
jgi:Ion channel